MTTLPYFGNADDAIARAQHEAERMREHGILPPLPVLDRAGECADGCDGCCKAADDLGCGACGCC